MIKIANGQGSNGNRLRVFSVHDSNQDGVLSKQEYQRFIEHLKLRQGEGRQQRHFPLLRFEQIDTNKDGAITEDEMLHALNKRLERHQRERYRGGWR